VKAVVQQQAAALGPAHPATLRMQMAGLVPLLNSRGDAAGAQAVVQTSQQLDTNRHRYRHRTDPFCGSPINVSPS
jgi:hypothetical protein